MSLPETFPNRILVLSVGTSPQIVTEVLFALTVQRSKQGLAPFVPTRIVVVSTQTGVDTAREQLEGPDGHYAQLCQDYRLPDMPSQLEYLIITNQRGEALDDIRNSQDNGDAANHIANTLRELALDHSAALHVSMAGGRKTQGYYTGFALSLFGRPQDRLSHVLVSEGYEGLKDFFYPTPAPRRISRQTQDGVQEYDASLAEVELADIPFVLLRDWVPQKYHADPHLDIAALVNQVRTQQAAAALDTFELCIDLPNRQVRILDSVVNFDKHRHELAYLLMMAMAKQNPEQVDDFTRPNPGAKQKEYHQLTHRNAVAFARAYLVLKGATPEHSRLQVPDDFFYREIGDRESPLMDVELIGQKYKNKKITEQRYAKLSKPQRAELLEELQEAIYKQREKDSIENIKEEWGLETKELKPKELSFIETFIGCGMPERYMDERNSSLKKLMSQEFIDDILREVIPSGGYHKNGKEQRSGKKGLHITAERIHIIHH